MRVSSGTDLKAIQRKLKKSGDTLILEKGQYKGGVTFSGYSKFTMVFEPGATIRGSSGGAGLKFDKCQALTVTGPGVVRDSRKWGIMIVLSKGVTVSGIRSVFNRTTGLLSGNVDELTVERGFFNDNGGHGLYASQSGDVIRFLGNTCERNADAGIQVNAREDDGPSGSSHDSISEYVDIIGNTLRGNQHKGGAAGISIACARLGHLRGNRILDHRGRDGIAFFSDSLPGAQFACHNWDVEGNEVTFSPRAGAKANVRILDTCTRIEVSPANKWSPRAPAVVKEKGSGSRSLPKDLAERLAEAEW